MTPDEKRIVRSKAAEEYENVKVPPQALHKVGVQRRQNGTEHDGDKTEREAKDGGASSGIVPKYSEGLFC